MEETVNQRFNKAVTHLLETKKASNKKQIAESLQVSPSYFTEILKERLKISADLLQIFLSKWQINPNYIFGSSEQILISASNEIEDGAITAKEPIHNYSSQHQNPHNLPSLKQSQSKLTTVDNTGNDNVVMVPVEAQLDYLSGYNNPDFIRRLPTYNIPKLSSNSFRAFEVNGNSMAPTVAHGDVIFAEWTEKFTDIIDDTVYVIISKREGVLVKRIINCIEQHNYIIAKSDSLINQQQYPNIKIPSTDIIELWQAKMYLNTNLENPQSIWDRITSIEMAIEDLKKTK